MQCLGYYADVFFKAAGDHGGHVIGRTRSGKPIYASKHESNSYVMGMEQHSMDVLRGDAASKAHPGFNAEDHLDAADAHAALVARASSREQREGAQHMSTAHAMAFMRHRQRDNKAK